MPIPGLDSILFKSASAVWPSDTWPDGNGPDPATVTYFDMAANQFHEERPEPDKALAALNAINQATLQPSQQMRFAFLMGRSLVAKGEIQPGVAFFHQAMDVAREHKDRDSVCEILLRTGHTAYNAQRHRAALEYYKTTYATWLDYFPDPNNRSVAAEIMLRESIGTEQWLVGKIEEAHQTIASVVTLAEGKSSAVHTLEFTNSHANALWTLGLIFRSRSDVRNGDEGYLHDAIERFLKSIGLYKKAGAESYQVGRISIQIAEAYLDLAELHLGRTKTESARSINMRANAFADQAADYLHLANDPEGRNLARITQLRLRLIKTRRIDSVRTFQSIEDDFATIEGDPITQKDEALVAKSLTLRAEWLIRLGDTQKGCETLQMAIKTFGEDGKGMATRAERLYRAHCTSVSPENPSGPESYNPN